jgi:hypothetical protein
MLGVRSMQVDNFRDLTICSLIRVMRSNLIFWPKFKFVIRWLHCLLFFGLGRFREELINIIISLGVSECN